MTQVQATNKEQPTKQEIKQQTVHIFNPKELTIIGLDTKDGESHPLYDPRIKIKLSDEVVRNYATFGCLEPVLVCKIGNDTIVVDGRQRVRYSRAAKLERIKAIYINGDPASLWAVGQAANIHTPSGPVVTALAMVKSLRMGRDYAQVADQHGVTPQTVRNQEHIITKLAPEVLAKMEKDELSSTAALHLTVLTMDEQKEVVAEVGPNPPVEAVRRAVNNRRGKTGRSLKDKVDDAHGLLAKYQKNAGGHADATKEVMAKLIDDMAKKIWGKEPSKLFAPETEKTDGKGKGKKAA